MTRLVPAALAATAAAGLTLVALWLATLPSVAQPPASLVPAADPGARARILDRDGEALAISYAEGWNLHDRTPIHRVPPLLRNAFVAAEDQRFFSHSGVDWRARSSALLQNVRAGRVVRGASTISEQVAGMLRPRPRALWSRWLEGFEARRLESVFSKGEILEFYLDQVPFAGQRRGVAQAARDYFDRDLETLSPRECLVLAALVRSPSRLDPRRSAAAAAALERAVAKLAERMERSALLAPAERASLAEGELELREPRLPLAAPHFVRWARQRSAAGGAPEQRVRTYLASALQRRAGELLEHQIAALAERGVSDGAVLVVDHESDEILAWVNAGGFSEAVAGSQIDAVLAARQPGSTLKPFLYALALERGWTAATLIEDAPFAGAVGRGVHAYRNYSRRFYGPLRLREALGNSLNIPAVRTAKALTPSAFLERLRRLGFDSLDRHPDVYGEGLALGNGEVTLHELVGAYAALARGGVWRPLVALESEPRAATRRVFDEEVATLIADILADPEARRREFGAGGVLELPVETAVKTGTSNDYRDAWAVGFSGRYTVGVWMGNLDRRAMEGVTGSIGPGLVLRGVFAELGRDGETRPLKRARSLARHPVCAASGRRPGAACPRVEEWFRPGREPVERCAVHAVAAAPVPPSASAAVPADVALVEPTPGLLLAMDPRIPDELEAFPLQVRSPRRSIARVEWYVDGRRLGVTGRGETRFLWHLEPGRHEALARVWLEGTSASVDTQRVGFRVK